MASKINFLVHKQSKHAERVHTVAMATKMKEKKFKSPTFMLARVRQRINSCV